MAPRDAGPEPLDPHGGGGDAKRWRWMAVLAKASTNELERAWAATKPQPDYETLRAPETGLVMVRGRIGGTGDAFNLGEMSMTRCAVRIGRDTGAHTIGHAFVAGRDHRHAELAAVFDALLQAGRVSGTSPHDIVEALAMSQAARKRRTAQQSAETRVDFFTMVRE